jgi:hypothetical protein
MFSCGALRLFPDGGTGACGMARFDWTSQETLTGFSMAGLSQRELIVWREAIKPWYGLPKPEQTWLICHDKIEKAGFALSRGNSWLS